MTVVCAWCCKDIGQKPGSGTTHGICDPCRSRVLAPLSALPTAPAYRDEVVFRCEHGTPVTEFCTACESEV